MKSVLAWAQLEYGREVPVGIFRIIAFVTVGISPVVAERDWIAVAEEVRDVDLVLPHSCCSAEDSVRRERRGVLGDTHISGGIDVNASLEQLQPLDFGPAACSAALCLGFQVFQVECSDAGSLYRDVAEMESLQLAPAVVEEGYAHGWIFAARQWHVCVMQRGIQVDALQVDSPERFHLRHRLFSRQAEHAGNDVGSIRLDDNLATREVLVHFQMEHAAKMHQHVGPKPWRQNHGGTGLCIVLMLVDAENYLVTLPHQQAVVGTYWSKQHLTRGIDSSKSETIVAESGLKRLGGHGAIGSGLGGRP